MSESYRHGMIAIRRIEFQGRHGATASERETLRRFQVDIEISGDVNAAVESDRLVNTVDYHEVCTIVNTIGTGAPFHLIEALAGSILAALDKRWPEPIIQVEVRKLHPPCPGNPEFAAVTVSNMLEKVAAQKLARGEVS